MNPAVGIVIPSFNVSAFIRAVCESLLAQTHIHWEAIIVDDGSRDDIRGPIEDLLKANTRISYLRKENGGVASARNYGYRNLSPRASYLMFLDGDDVLKPNALSRMVEELECCPDMGMIHCEPDLIDASGESLHGQSWESWLPRYAESRWGVRILPANLQETPFISVFNLAGIIPSLTVIRRSIYDLTPGWDEEFGQHYEDTDLFLQIAIRSKVRYTAERLVCHRRHATQNTADPERFGRQEEKLYEKWREMSGLDANQRKIVRHAWRFRQRYLIPTTGWVAGTHHLKKGEMRKAVRFYGGAVRRYLQSWSRPLGV